MCLGTKFFLYIYLRIKILVVFKGTSLENICLRFYYYFLTLYIYIYITKYFRNIGNL